jgi:hypothetical protein
MLKSMSYKSLEDTYTKIIPTCFRSQRIHHQGVITCTLNEITCSGSQIKYFPARRNAHTYTTGSEYSPKHRPRTR